MSYVTENLTLRPRTAGALGCMKWTNTIKNSALQSHFQLFYEIGSINAKDIISPTEKGYWCTVTDQKTGLVLQNVEVCEVSWNTVNLYTKSLLKVN